MISERDGGSAFPTVFSSNDLVHGMSLRDYFAAKALDAQVQYEGMEGCDKTLICAMAYELADQMLIERQREYKSPRD